MNDGDQSTKAGPPITPRPEIPRTAAMAIMEAASLAHRQALESGNELDRMIAHLVVAADLAQRRVGGVEGLAEAAKAAEKFARRAGDDDVMIRQALPPNPGPIRTDAVRTLLERAGQVERARPRDAAQAWKAAEFLCRNALILGLAKDTAARGQWLADKLLENDELKAHAIARLTLQAAGIDRKTADNWIGPAV